MTPLWISVVREVLANAKDAGDKEVVAACRRVLDAWRRGWKKYGNPADLALVNTFADMED